MKNIRRDREGVSPVIAVILMVAIAVVLSAVLYVMVSSMLQTGGTQTPIIGMKWNEDLSNPGNYSGNVLRIEGGDPPRLKHVTLVYIQGSESNTDTLEGIETGDLVVGSMTMTFSDGDGNSKIGAEDTFTITGGKEGDILRLVHSPSAGEMYSRTF